jgi:hypothetical protein
MRQMTQEQAKAILKIVGVTLVAGDEYRVNIRGGSEATAYYTDDIQDAVKTGLAMAYQANKVTQCYEPIRPLRAPDNGAAYCYREVLGGNYLVDYGSTCWPSRSYMMIITNS